MRGNTQGERKLSNPAVNEIASPNDAPSSIEHSKGSSRGAARRARALQWWYGLKYRVFRRERRPRDGRRGLIVLQVDALAYADLRRWLELREPARRRCPDRRLHRRHPRADVGLPPAGRRPHGAADRAPPGAHG